MIFFPNMTMTRYTYTNTGTGVYGETIKSYSQAGTLTVDFQNEGNAELAKQYGVERKNLYKIYMDIHETLEDEDILVDQDNNQYQVIGEIQEYNHFHMYKIAHLVHCRGDQLCQ